MHWLSPESSSRALYQRARRVFPAARTREVAWVAPYPPYLRSGRGSWIRDEDGHRILDLNANLGALVHGHAHPLINAAIADQLERGTCFALPTETELRLAELLCGRVPGFEQLRFTSSGGESIRLALEAARAWTGRKRILRIGDQRFLGRDDLHIRSNDRSALAQRFDVHGGEIAAVLLEPVPIATGREPLAADFLAAVSELTRDHGSLLVCDEVLCFRLGFAGAQGELGLAPDLTALGKLIGGGLPAGAVAGRADVMSMFGTEQTAPRVRAGNTYSGHPLSMVAGEATLNLLDSTAFEGLGVLGNYCRTRLAYLLDGERAPLSVRGSASMFRLVPHDSNDTGLMHELQSALLAEGVLIGPDGSAYLSTALRRDDLDVLFDGLPRALRRLSETPNRAGGTRGPGT